MSAALSISASVNQSPPAVMLGPSKLRNTAQNSSGGANSFDSVYSDVNKQGVQAKGPEQPANNSSPLAASKKQAPGKSATDPNRTLPVPIQTAQLQTVPPLATTNVNTASPALSSIASAIPLAHSAGAAVGAGELNPNSASGGSSPLSAFVENLQEPQGQPGGLGQTASEGSSLSENNDTLAIDAGAASASAPNSQPGLPLEKLPDSRRTAPVQGESCAAAQAPQVLPAQVNPGPAATADDLLSRYVPESGSTGNSGAGTASGGVTPSAQTVAAVVQTANRLTAAQTIASHLHLPADASQPASNRGGNSATTAPAVDSSGKTGGMNQSNSDAETNAGSSNSTKQGETENGGSKSNANAIRKADVAQSAFSNSVSQIATSLSDPGTHSGIDATTRLPLSTPDSQSSGSVQPLTREGTPSTDQPLAPSLPTSLNDVVQASRLYQHVGGAEMHIAMDTELLGSIDVRAMLHQSTLTATIGVQRSDVQSLLSSDLPALQHSLSEHNLHVGEVSILGNSIGSSTGQHNSQSQSQYQEVPTANPVAMNCAKERNTTEQRAEAPEGPSVLGAGRLNVRA